MKKIEIGGKEYRRKYLMKLGIKNGRGVSIRQKDMSLYDVAVAYTRDDQGNGRWYSVMDMKDFYVICYDEDERMVDIVFEDVEAKRHWDKVFIYLSDNLGALMFMADRVLNCKFFFPEKAQSPQIKISNCKLKGYVNSKFL